jgi:hypothetical protein
MPFYNCYHSVEIDQDSHPGFKPKDEAIAIAKTMTTNPISDFDYEGDESEGWWYLVFQENVIVESPDEESLEFQEINPQCEGEESFEFQEINPQCEGAEFNSATKVRKNKLKD